MTVPFVSVVGLAASSRGHGPLRLHQGGPPLRRRFQLAAGAVRGPLVDAGLGARLLVVLACGGTLDGRAATVALAPRALRVGLGGAGLARAGRSHAAVVPPLADATAVEGIDGVLRAAPGAPPGATY